MKKQKIIIVAVLGLIALFVMAGKMYNNFKADEFSKMSKERSELFERPYSWSVGNKDAKVHLVEFFDPACETCAQFYPLVKDIMKKNEGKIRLTMRYAPYHQGSAQVVKMLEAARKQGKYEETLEMMFATQKYWASHHNPNPQLLWKYLPQLGLDIDRLMKDMKDPEMDKLVAQELSDAKELGATKTPSYFVNGKPLQHFGYEQLKELIYSEL